MNFKKQMALAIFILLWVALFIGLVLAPLVAHVANRGRIRTVNIKVWADAAGTIPLTEIDWGTVDLNTTVTHDLWLQAMGTDNVTVTMTTGNYVPTSVIPLLTVTWNKEGAIVTKNTLTPATITLAAFGDPEYVIDNNILDFTFDITLTGTTT